MIAPPNRRSFIGAAAGVLLAPSVAQAAPRLRVVELFTSQGCSSCPPADRELTRLADRADVLALSFHVDYWDYIGWKDPFAKPAFTERQRGYARALAQRSVYTPQMVVDGVAHDPGFGAARIAALFSNADRVRRGPAVEPRAAADGAGWRIDLAAAAIGGSADLWLATFDRRHVTEVKRGENRGATLSNAHVVRSLERVGGWTGEATTVRVAPSLGAGQGAALLVQRADAGEVLGATYLRGAAPA